MSSLVGAVKTYAYMDRGELNEVDLHEGLETTLTVLGHRLKHTSIEVVRRYDRTGHVVWKQQFGTMKGDIAMGISTSGASANVVAGLVAARALGLGTIALTGGDGGAVGRAAAIVGGQGCRLVHSNFSRSVFRRNLLQIRRQMQDGYFDTANAEILAHRVRHILLAAQAPPQCAAADYISRSDRSAQVNRF